MIFHISYEISFHMKC